MLNSENDYKFDQRYVPLASTAKGKLEQGQKFDLFICYLQ